MNCSDLSALNLDGDIAGIGVRVSFYVQNIILVLLMERSHEDTENALWTFVATSFGLVVAAMTQLVGGRLNLIDGIIVSQLVWFANLGTFFALASYSRSKGRDAVIKIAATLQGYLSMLLTIAMWAWSNRLPYGSCHSVRFVFMFGVDLPAPTSGRVIGLVFSSLALAAFTAMTCVEVWVWMKKERLNHQIHDPARQRHHRHDRFHGHWAGSLHKIGSFFFGILLSQMLIFVYFVSTTELIIKRSNANLSPSTWTFGQVLALTVVLPSLVALLRDVKDKWLGYTPKNPNNPSATVIPL